uniref:CSON006364 protein n=1 Tax=Culicoides sonorensis TaxID=179676 RepID=A0A336KBC9_CULSO
MELCQVWIIFAKLDYLIYVYWNKSYKDTHVSFNRSLITYSDIVGYRRNFYDTIKMGEYNFNQAY